MNFRWRSAAAAVMVALPLSPVAAADWVKLGRDTSGAVFQFDRSSLKRRSETAVAMLRGEYSRAKSVPIRESRTLYQFRCEEGSAARVSVKEYSASGETVHEYTPSKDQVTYDPVPSGTVTESLMLLACGNATGKHFR